MKEICWKVYEDLSTMLSTCSENLIISNKEFKILNTQKEDWGNNRKRHKIKCKILNNYIVQSFRHVWLFATPWTAPRQASLSITNSWNILRLMCTESVMPSNHLILYLPFSCLQSFPASGSFPMIWFFESGGQSTGVSTSASVLPMNIQDWFPLGWRGWISLQCKGLSRVFSSTTVQKHQFFGAQLSL